jgi:hypothetical protein
MHLEHKLTKQQIFELRKRSLSGPPRNI